VPAKWYALNKLSVFTSDHMLPAFEDPLSKIVMSLMSAIMLIGTSSDVLVLT